MKKILVMALILMISISAFAQFQAGNILITGTFVLKGDQSKRTNGGTTVQEPITTTFEIGPGIEYFFTEKISFGGEIIFSSEKEVDKDPGGGLDETIDKTNMTAIVPFASYYFINQERFALFGRLGIGFGFGKNTYETISGSTTVTDEEKLSSFGIALKPGISVNLTEKFGMTATVGAIGYYSYKTDDGNTVYKSSAYGIEISPALGFGIFYKLM